MAITLALRLLHEAREKMKCNFPHSAEREEILDILNKAIAEIQDKWGRDNGQ